MRCFALVLASSLILELPSAVHAATMDVLSVTGSFDILSAAPSTGMTGKNSDHVAWGATMGTAGQSGYSFSGDAPASFESGADFVLGRFTHHNQPIGYGTSISSARLDVSIGLRLGGAYRTVTAGFGLSHWETRNDGEAGGLCANGGANSAGINSAGCADRVIIRDALDYTEEFAIGNAIYALRIRGFLQDGQIASEFWTAEREDNNTAEIVGRLVWLRDIPQAPLPAAGWLLLFATLALAATRHLRPG